MNQLLTERFSVLRRNKNSLEINWDEPVAVPYKGDTCTPVFSWKKESYTSTELVGILVRTYEAHTVCIAAPVNVSHNVAFLVDQRKFSKFQDAMIWVHGDIQARLNVHLLHRKETKREPYISQHLKVVSPIQERSTN